MLQTTVQGSLNLSLFMPGWIIVPADHIQIISKFAVIKSLIVIHKIGGHWFCSSTITQCLDLPAHKIPGLMGDKPFPVQLQSVHFPLSNRGRTFYLVKILVNVTPEGSIPAFVQMIDGVVTVLQPCPELLLT